MELKRVSQIVLPIGGLVITRLQTSAISGGIDPAIPRLEFHIRCLPGEQIQKHIHGGAMRSDGGFGSPAIQAQLIQIFLNKTERFCIGCQQVGIFRIESGYLQIRKSAHQVLQLKFLQFNQAKLHARCILY